MENNLELTNKILTPREWLIYYKNIWTRNAVARAIDVNTDQVLKVTTPDAVFLDQNTGQTITVAERLENRKISVQDALDIIAGADRLLATPDEEFEKTYFSAEALKVSPDMIPSPFAAELTPEAQKESEPAPVVEEKTPEVLPENNQETPSEEAAQ